MKIKMIAVPLVVLLTAIAGHAQNVAASPVGAEFVGVWRAEADGLPFVTLNISNESGNLSGAVLFYLHRRDQGKPVTSTPGIPEPIF
ncbi:MAG TPA: hypothetical protein VH308_12240, partial [Terracidiphilus sp.]|nr:hypothetical protein [Terracidiphilus sp.]